MRRTTSRRACSWCSPLRRLPRCAPSRSARCAARATRVLLQQAAARRRQRGRRSASQRLLLPLRVVAPQRAAVSTMLRVAHLRWLAPPLLGGSSLRASTAASRCGQCSIARQRRQGASSFLQRTPTSWKALQAALFRLAAARSALDRSAATSLIVTFAQYVFRFACSPIVLSFSIRILTITTLFFVLFLCAGCDRRRAGRCRQRERLQRCSHGVR